MPYKPNRVHCNACGTWIVEVDGRGEVLRANRKVIQREHRGVHPANSPTWPPPELDEFPGAEHMLTMLYICSCREGQYGKASVVPARPMGTL